MQTPDLPHVETAIVALTNAFRAEQGLTKVAPSPVLAAVARAFADYLARTGRFSHTADGRDPGTRARAAGYAFCQIGENLASHLDSRGFRTRQLAEKAIESWKASPGHRKTMLLPHVTEIGVAVARAPDKHPKYISVQVFGRPERLKIAYTVRNETDVTVTYSDGSEDFTAEPSVIASHEQCLPTTLTFTRTTATGRFKVRNGDVFVVRGKPGSITVERTQAPPTPHAR